MISRIFALVVKEVLALIKDKRARVVLIVPPIVQLFVFAWAATLDVKNVSIGVLNKDWGEKSFELIQRFSGSPTFKKIVYLHTEQELAPFIDNQEGVMVVSINENFSRNVNAKKPAEVQLILDGRKSNTAQIVVGYATAIISQFADDISAEIQKIVPKSAIIPRNFFNPNLIYYWYNVPSLAGILTMLVGLIVTALSIAREREVGTFDQLLVSPLKPIEILLGKTIPAVIIGLAEGTIIILAGIFIFQIPFTGHLLFFYLSLFVFVCSVVGVGLFISALSSTQQQAILGTFVFMSPSVLLSGFATPIENMPVWLQYVTYLNPLRYILVIAKGSFLKTMPPSIILQNTWPMVLIAMVNLTAAMLLFRRRLE